MLKDITLGQYYQSDSQIHRLDPRTILFCFFMYVCMLFMSDNFVSYILSGMVLLMLIKFAKIPYRFIFRGLRAVITIVLIGAFFNLFFTPGDVVFKWKFIVITYEGIVKTALITVRFVLIILASSLLTLTTTPNSITDGIERGLGFLTIIKVPIHEIAMMMSIALRFIPILAEETDKIRKAQIARGADFENGGISKKIKSLSSILVPLFVSAFRRANDLATAMDARCYRGGKGRTKMHPLVYESRDIAAYVLVVLFILLLIAVRLYFNQIVRIDFLLKWRL